MTSAVRGLVKIGKTETHNFESRMRNLENNGYFNVAGLRRLFAIEVEDYSEKEKMLHEIFEKARLDSSELFAINKDLAMELLSAFEGRVVYPPQKSKDKIFDDAAKAVEVEIEQRAKKITGARAGVIVDSEGRLVEGRALGGKTGVYVSYLREVAQDERHAEKLKDLAKTMPNTRLSTTDTSPDGKEYFAFICDGVYAYYVFSKDRVPEALSDITSALGIEAELEDRGRLSELE